MTANFLMPNLSFVVDYGDLLTQALFHYFGRDLGTLNGRRADLHLAIPVHEQNLVESDLVSFFSVVGQLLDPKDIPFRDLVLLPAGFDDCESHNGLILEYIMEKSKPLAQYN